MFFESASEGVYSDPQFAWLVDDSNYIKPSCTTSTDIRPGIAWLRDNSTSVKSCDTPSTNIDHETSFPIGVRNIRMEFYANDMIFGENSIEEAINIIFEVTALLKWAEYKVLKSNQNISISNKLNLLSLFMDEKY